MEGKRAQLVRQVSESLLEHLEINGGRWRSFLFSRAHPRDLTAQYAHRVAPLPIIPETYRITINYTDATGKFLGSNVINVFAAASNTDTVGTTVASVMTTAMFDTTSTSVVIPSIDVIPYDGISPTKSFVVVGMTGGSVGQWIPNTALVVTLKTPFRGRSFRGRVYVGFPAEGITADGIFEVTPVNNVLTGWQQFQLDLLSNAMAQSVVSTLLSLATLILTYEANSRNDTQRRRLNVVGP